MSVDSKSVAVGKHSITIWIISSIVDREKPYPHLSNAGLMGQLRDDAGFVHPKPAEDCSQGLYNLLEECWKRDPKERPSFVQILKRLEEMHGQLMGSSLACAGQDDLPTDAHAVTIIEDNAGYLKPRAPASPKERGSVATHESVTLSVDDGGGNSMAPVQPSNLEAVTAVASAMMTFDEQPISRGFSDDSFAAVARQSSALKSPGQGTRSSGVLYVSKGEADRPLLKLSDEFDEPVRHTSDV